MSVRPVRRRRWSPEEKLSIVRETLGPGAVAKVVADRHGIGTGLLFTWRRQMLATAMGGFAEVGVVPEVPSLTAPEGSPVESAPDPLPPVEVTFASGARLVLRGEVYPALLREVVAELARR